MDTVKKTLLDRVNESWLEYKTIPLATALAIIIYFSSALVGITGVDPTNKTTHLRWIPWLAFSLLGLLLAYTARCIVHNMLPKAKRNTVAALFVIDAENAKLYGDVQYKLVTAFSEIQAPTKIAFSAVCVPAKRLSKYCLQNVDDATKVLKKCRCEFLIRVRYTVDDVNNAEDFSLTVNYAAAHPQFAESVKSVFAYDLSSLCASVRKQRFTKAEIIDTFDFTAQTLLYICRYLLGFICLLAGYNESALVLLTELKQELDVKGHFDSFSILLAKMTRQRLYAAYAQTATEENTRFREDHDYAHLSRFKRCLDLANEIYPDTFFYNINMAYYCVIEEADGKHAKSCIDKCRQSKEERIWLYSDAFLSAYFGNAPQTIYSKYKRAFEVNYDLSRLAEYIEMVLEKDQTKVRLYFALGLLYERIGDPIKMKRSFAFFLEHESKLDEKTREQLTQKMTEDCGLKCLHDCGNCNSERLI